MKVTINCTCGYPLDWAALSSSQKTKDVVLEVLPCSKCQEKAEEDAYERGQRDAC